MKPLLKSLGVFFTEHNPCLFTFQIGSIAYRMEARSGGRYVLSWIGLFPRAIQNNRWMDSMGELDLTVKFILAKNHKFFSRKETGNVLVSVDNNQTSKNR